MDDKRIIVEIKPDGSVKVKAEGYEGESCYEATRALEDKLGVVTDTERTSEYWREERQKADQ